MPAAAAVADLWTNLPTLTKLIPFTDLLTFFQTILDGKVIYLAITDQLQVQWIVYTGILMVMSMCLVSAAYVAYRSVDAVVAFSKGYHFNYQYRFPKYGNELPYYELGSFFLYQAWSLGLTIWTFMGASELWTMVETREKESKTQGKYGEPFDAFQAMKYFALTMVVGMGTVIGAFSLGDTAVKILSWYDEYESTGADVVVIKPDYEDGDKTYADGDAQLHDLIFHFTTMGGAYMLFSVIAFGAHVFGYLHMQYLDTIECDLNLYDDATKAQMLAARAGFTSLEACYEGIRGLMALVDANGNGYVDRCEDANLLQVFDPSNTDAYALKFSHTQPLSTWKQRCDTLFNPLWG